MKQYALQLESLAFQQTSEIAEPLPAGTGTNLTHPTLGLWYVV